MTSGKSSQSSWRPQRLIRVVESYDTSTGTTKVKTDATFGYLKAMGNHQGPHVLAAEFVASSLADWFGLTVPEFALLSLPKEACFDLPRGAHTQPGPAFISRHIPGRTWGGSEAEVRTLENQADITRLVVFDTWVRNCDRYPPDLAARKPNYANVYLAYTRRSSRTRLVAIDHTHCFDCGRDLSEHLTDIDRQKDDRTYGLFPSFKPFISLSELLWCKAMLRTVTRELVDEIVAKVPPEWQVAASAIDALGGLIHGRAAYIADRIDDGWTPQDNPPMRASES